MQGACRVSAAATAIFSSGNFEIHSGCFFFLLPTKSKNNSECEHITIITTSNNSNTSCGFAQWLGGRCYGSVTWLLISRHIRKGSNTNYHADSDFSIKKVVYCSHGRSWEYSWLGWRARDVTYAVKKCGMGIFETGLVSLWFPAHVQVDTYTSTCINMHQHLLMY